MNEWHRGANHGTTVVTAGTTGCPDRSVMVSTLRYKYAVPGARLSAMTESPRQTRRSRPVKVADQIKDWVVERDLKQGAKLPSEAEMIRCSVPRIFSEFDTQFFSKRFLVERAIKAPLRAA